MQKKHRFFKAGTPSFTESLTCLSPCIFAEHWCIEKTITSFKWIPASDSSVKFRLALMPVRTPEPSHLCASARAAISLQASVATVRTSREVFKTSKITLSPSVALPFLCFSPSVALLFLIFATPPLRYCYVCSPRRTANQSNQHLKLALSSGKPYVFDTMRAHSG